METKKTQNSKTIWLNAIVGLAAVIGLINPELLTAIGIAPAKHESVLAITGVAVAIINIYLRTITDTAITIDGKKS